MTTHRPALRAVLGLTALALLLAAAWMTTRHFGWLSSADPSELARRIEAARALRWAAPLFVVAYSLAAALGLPATPFTLAGGALFGVRFGTVLNWIGASIGATLAFLLARTLGHGAVQTLLGKRAAVLERWAGGGSFATLIRLRLLPVVPVNGLNFGAGLAGVRPSAFVWSTALGIVPGTFVYTYFASALLAGASGARRGALVDVFVAGGLLVMLSFVPSLARRMRWIASVCALAGAGAAASAQTPAPAATPDHAPFSAMLAAYVTDGMVDYDAFARDPRFPAYLHSLESVRAARLSREDRLAYWVNVYNAYTIQLINSRGERSSIRHINRVLGVTVKSPWSESIVRADGRALTLDDVEHQILRPEFKDPRIHVALVCAAKGCPPLRSEAYVGSRINEQLDDQARRFLSQSHKNRVDIATRTVFGSPIFTWYREDFGGTIAGVANFWVRYIPAGATRDLLRAGAFTWRDTEYDWSLNLRR